MKKHFLFEEVSYKSIAAAARIMLQAVQPVCTPDYETDDKLSQINFQWRRFISMWS